jgi:hypothetical protein
MITTNYSHLIITITATIITNYGHHHHHCHHHHQSLSPASPIIVTTITNHCHHHHRQLTVIITNLPRSPSLAPLSLPCHNHHNHHHHHLHYTTSFITFITQNIILFLAVE